jgi:hypothetical protein
LRFHPAIAACRERCSAVVPPALGRSRPRSPTPSNPPGGRVATLLLRLLERRQIFDDVDQVFGRH